MLSSRGLFVDAGNPATSSRFPKAANVLLRTTHWRCLPSVTRSCLARCFLLKKIVSVVRSDRLPWCSSVPPHFCLVVIATDLQQSCQVSTCQLYPSGSFTPLEIRVCTGGRSGQCSGHLAQRLFWQSISRFDRDHRQPDHASGTFTEAAK